jgi:hypothetical protein
MMDILEEKCLWENSDENGTKMLGRILQICSRHGTGRQQQGREEEGGERQSRRPWPKQQAKKHH